MASKEVKCYLCGTFYRPEKSVCTLSCRFHPLAINTLHDGKNFTRGHYECCGASKNPVDKEHYEITNPKGCVMIDHVSSEEELRKLVSKPYVILSKEEYLKNYKVQFAEVKIINNKNELVEWHIEIPLKKRKVTIDLRTIYYDKISKEIKRNDLSNDDKIGEYLKDTSKLYQYDINSLEDIERDQSLMLSDQKNFIPFVIARRIGEKQDCMKLEEVNFFPKRKCSYFNK